MILVDTNVWSEMVSRNGEPGVIAWLAEHDRQLLLSVLVIAEIRAGLEKPSAKAFRSRLERWLAQLETDYADRIVPFDRHDAHVFGQLAAQRTLGGNTLDAQIAAQAIVRNIPVATRNTADFAWTGVRLINPWED
ncbi:MAG: recombinase [Blastomonas sp. CACIA14H2]|uniref:type II toxin-antitoxin system VapC family toxin n=1 Tax=Blastomonas sp. CACIA14H2 TaxID=1419876 RepID=UPI0003CFD539|nr:MAG: recombinase [Blastomonas sp. CACIA14H2]